MKPQLIDTYTKKIIKDVNTGVWHIEKPASLKWSLVDNFRNAWLVLMGKATPVYFYKDVRPRRKRR